jgi:hypothetical protein
MHKSLLLALAATAMASSVGCILPIHSPERTRRMQQLLFMSENLRQIPDEWERAWLLDQPSHMTLYRTHGGL